AIRISIASPEQIRAWSSGEVQKGETINYRTQRPEKDGLFCEKIFGPTKDWECQCGKYKRQKYKGVVCDRCGVEVTRSNVRRQRLGHIALAAPVANIWFVKNTPSVMSLALDLKLSDLTRVLYYSAYVINRVDIELMREKLEQHVSYDRLKPFWDDAFEADMGAEPVLESLKLLDRGLDQERYYTEQEMRATSSQIRTKAGKRMRLLETFRRSENRMQDMIMTILPVLPPELRPMVQLDGGRFATSDLNDLYRRVLSRNHRLKRFASMRAPGLMIRNEKRMLQEAVDSLIDNGRQGKAVKGKRDHALKSLSDLLKGKQGRFRQNLLGKRVDYSGRSVIVVGPELKMDQCGLPKRMALELFKPFVMHRLVLSALAPNIKAAKRMVERSSPEVWHILEDVIKDRPVMLNRAPTLHRLGIQAFKPVLIEGSAIQLHPLVCSAFNADFDGDQMAVHVPLSTMAVNETRTVMLSINNMLSPASGDPLVAPTLDMVMGCYYLTELLPDGKGAGNHFYDIHEARIAYSDGQIDLRAPISVIDVAGADGPVDTTMGRLIFNETIPDSLGYKNQVMDRGAIKDLTSELYRNLTNVETAQALDKIKEMGFYYATKSGITIAINDIQVPARKHDILEAATQKVSDHENNFMMGMMTENEKYDRIIETWTKASDDMQTVVEDELKYFGGVAVMAMSGAKGNISQIKQMAGMRGLMSDPEGRIIERPVKSSFREGLTALEYFISTHGARKGLTDTALRTADSGYLTRRLVDVSQEVIVQEPDCEYAEPFYVEPRPNDPTLTSFAERMVGRMAGDVIADPRSGEIIIDRNEMIDEGIAEVIKDAGIERVPVRSPLTCQTRRGICQMCYGRLPATGNLVEIGQAVGVIAAQSIGEPGTQLTMRTFHTGGIAGSDITTGLPRVQETV
ncbi:DNA-directed RNA polymerase subunit beta', partial [Geodia barretti]